jgi:hypothetical protein
MDLLGRHERWVIDQRDQEYQMDRDQRLVFGAFPSLR